MSHNLSKENTSTQPNTTCWVCMATFNSNSKLFKHLRDSNHEIDPPKRCIACKKDNYVDIRNHCLICECKHEFSRNYLYNRGYTKGYIQANTIEEHYKDELAKSKQYIKELYENTPK